MIGIMKDVEFTGLEKDRKLWIQERLTELKEEHNHTSAELGAIEITMQELEAELEQLEEQGNLIKKQNEN